MTSGSALNGLM